MGVGFTATLLAMGIIRELLGSRYHFGLPITAGFMDPILIFILPPGGFFVFGLLIALANKLSGEGKSRRKWAARVALAANCSKLQEKEAGKK